MTVVMKIGGKSQRTPELVEEFVRQADDHFHDEPILWVFSAIGDTTDRLERSTGENFSYSHEKFLNDDRELSVAYQEARGLFESLYTAQKKTPVHANRAAFLTYGERLAAILGAAAIRKIRKRGASFLDYHDPRFLVVASEGENYLSATFDIERSSERAGEVLMLLNEHDVVIPGFGGISGGVIKTLGRGGSDESAFGCGNVLRANKIYICTDVDGIMQAVAGGLEDKPRTVEEIDVEEAKAGAFLGAKLPSEQALMPLENSYDTGHEPNVYIANASNFKSSKTRIVRNSTHNGVKFVAGRKIPLYAVVAGHKHRLLELERYMIENGVDYLVAVKSGTRAEIGIFGKGSDVAAEEFERRCRMLGINYEIDGTRAIVGVVGRGIKNMEGVDERLYAALRQDRVNVLSSHDYSDFSTGSIISKDDIDRAVKTIYRSFFLDRRM